MSELCIYVIIVRRNYIQRWIRRVYICRRVGRETRRKNKKSKYRVHPYANIKCNTHSDVIFRKRISLDPKKFRTVFAPDESTNRSKCWSTRHRENRRWCALPRKSIYSDGKKKRRIRVEFIFHDIKIQIYKYKRTFALTLIGVNLYSSADPFWKLNY